MVTMTKRRYFTLADFREEEAFLEEKHRDGWKLKQFGGIVKYTFEQGESEDYVYRLDFNPDHQEEESYIQMFEDCGWEYVLKFNEWYYFRKARSQTSDLDNEIFSNNESRFEMIKKVTWRQLMVLIPILFLYIYMFVFVVNGFEGKDIGYQIIWLLYTLIMLFLLTISVRNVIKLNKFAHELE